MKVLPAVILFMIILGLMAYFFFIRPKAITRKQSVAGEVIFMEEQKRTGSLVIEIQESKGRRWIAYSFQDIQIGDSLFKKADSDLLFVKSKDDGMMRLTRDQDVLISELMTYK